MDFSRSSDQHEKMLTILLSITNYAGKCKSKPQRDTDTTSHPLGWLLSEDKKTELKIMSAVGMCRKENSCALLIGMQCATATMENGTVALQKVKHRIVI